MKIKEIPYRFSLALLTSGASLILGFLSFGGMLALAPILPLAISAFVLSVAYEGEIYLQNIKGALRKLSGENYLEVRFANDYLRNNLSDALLKAPDCPQFFTDYFCMLKKLDHFEHKHLHDHGCKDHSDNETCSHNEDDDSCTRNLDEDSRKRKNKIEQQLICMEEWFAKQLFAVDEGDSSYQNEIRLWIQKYKQDTWSERLNNRKRTFMFVKGFSVLSGIFMGFGTTYLLVEAFATLPMLAAIPAFVCPILIVPMAVLGGIAYGLLTYNAVTDIIQNETLQNWFRKIRNELVKGISLKSVLLAITTVLLIALAVALTVCTAGTWWTIAKEVKPLFAWMVTIPSFIMGIINPIITGLSSIVFNLQNTSETFDIFEAKIPDSEPSDEIKDDDKENKNQGYIKEFFSKLAKQARLENWVQLLNPFRLILKLTIMPLRILLFMGHLVSIGLTGDRVPGMSQTLSAILGFVSEGFEDTHYFFGHNHAHGHGTEGLLNARLGVKCSHNHDVDLPTRFLKLTFFPIYLLAAGWDYLSSKLFENRNPLTFSDAWAKQTGKAKEESVDFPTDKKYGAVSNDGQKEFIIDRLKSRQDQMKSIFCFGDPQTKKDGLSKLQGDIKKAGNSSDIKKLLKDAGNNPIYQEQRFFAQGERTETKILLDDLHSEQELCAR